MVCVRWKSCSCCSQNREPLPLAEGRMVPGRECSVTTLVVGAVAAPVQPALRSAEEVADPVARNRIDAKKCEYQRCHWGREVYLLQMWTVALQLEQVQDRQTAGTRSDPPCLVSVLSGTPAAAGG